MRYREVKEGGKEKVEGRKKGRERERERKAGGRRDLKVNYL